VSDAAFINQVHSEVIQVLTAMKR